MKHKINHQFIQIVDIDSEAKSQLGYTCVRLVVNGRLMPYHWYSFETNTGYLSAQKKAIALAARLSKQLGWEVRAA